MVFLFLSLGPYSVLIENNTQTHTTGGAYNIQAYGFSAEFQDLYANETTDLQVKLSWKYLILINI